MNALIERRLSVMTLCFYFLLQTEIWFMIESQNGRKIKTKMPLCLPTFPSKLLDKATRGSTFSEQCQRQHTRKALICILVWTPRLCCSIQRCIVLHLHNHRESSLLFRPRFLLIFLKPLCISAGWVGGLFVQRTLSCVYQRWRPLLRKCLF